MSSSPRAPRLIRGAAVPGEAFVLDGAARVEIGAVGVVASASEVVAAAAGRAREITEDARATAAAIIEAARAEAVAIEADAADAGAARGYAAGRDEALREALALIDLLRAAAAEGVAVRDQVAAAAAPVVARATMYAVRRIVGEYYEADPGRTSAAVEEALRAASGQQILGVRVNPALADSVRARLVDLARYVIPDAAIDVGGCFVDLDKGSIDATLDTRLRLVDLALTRAAGEVEP